MHVNVSRSTDLKQLARILLNIWLAMFVYVVFVGAVTLGTGFTAIEKLPRDILDWTFNFWLPWILLLPLVQLFLRRFIFVPPITFKNAAIFLAALLLLVAFHTALVAGMWYLRWLILAIETPIPIELILNIYVLRNGSLLFDVLIFTVLAASSGFHAMKEQLRAKELDAFKLSRSLTDSRLQTLKMQLNPHFLFNSLNGLSVLIDKNENIRAREMLGELSSFLRQTLRNPREKWVSLDKELEFVKMYLRIEQYRFGKRLTYFEECEPLALAAKIPPMLLQPLFENAIVHGLSEKQGPCRLSFECRLYDRFLIILIFDNGENFDEVSDPLHKGGIGLSNIQQRLREVYGDNYALGIEKKPDGTLVTLKLPAYKDSQF